MFLDVGAGLVGFVEVLPGGHAGVGELLGLLVLMGHVDAGALLAVRVVGGVGLWPVVEAQIVPLNSWELGWVRALRVAEGATV